MLLLLWLYSFFHPFYIKQNRQRELGGRVFEKITCDDPVVFGHTYYIATDTRPQWPGNNGVKMPLKVRITTLSRRASGIFQVPNPYPYGFIWNAITKKEKSQIKCVFRKNTPFAIIQRLFSCFLFLFYFLFFYIIYNK